MPHLEHVSVEGFKKIEELELSPGQFNVVTGRNNSGKTSFIDALRLSTKPQSISTFQQGLKYLINKNRDESKLAISTRDGPDTQYLRKPSRSTVSEELTEVLSAYILELYRHETDLDVNEIESFVHNSVTTEIEKFLTTDVINDLYDSMLEMEINGCDKIYFKRTPRLARLLTNLSSSVTSKLSTEFEFDPPSHDTSHRFLIHSRMDTQNSLNEGFLDPVPEPTVPTSLVTPEVSENNVWIAGENKPVREDDIGDFLREKEILDDLKSFSLDHLVFDPDDEEKYSVPFDQMGEGFKAIVGILWELLDDDLPEVVFLEEPDTHMHPGYVRELVYFLIDLAREEDIQLFVTTHNNDFLNDMFTENLTDEEVEFLEEEFRLIQMQDGAADVMDYREAEHTLEELMLDLRGL